MGQLQCKSAGHELATYLIPNEDGQLKQRACISKASPLACHGNTPQFTIRLCVDKRLRKVYFARLALTLGARHTKSIVL